MVSADYGKLPYVKYMTLVDALGGSLPPAELVLHNGKDSDLQVCDG